MDEIYDFTAANGTPFRAVIKRGKSVRESLIRFYDTRYDFTEHGQYFGAEYYVETLMSGYERLSKSGLCLYGGVPAWSIDARSFRTLAN